MAATIDTKFLTGSYYFGTFNMLNALHGYGSYTYPDGTQYMGYFKNGLFSGNGRFIVYYPYKMTFIGNFLEGKLADVDKIIFDDGLYFVVDKHGDKNEYSTDNWRYCSQNDRRFYREVYSGIEWKNITAPAKMRKLSHSSYDTEEGVYSPHTGFITKIKKPLNEKRFVGCKEEVAWIKQYCRCAKRVLDKFKTSKYGVPLHPVCPKVVMGNLKAMRELQGLFDDLVNDDCACNNFLRYFADIGAAPSYHDKGFKTTSGSSGTSLDSALQRNEIAIKIEKPPDSIPTTPKPIRSWSAKARLRLEEADQESVRSVKSEKQLEEKRSEFRFQLPGYRSNLV